MTNCEEASEYYNDLAKAKELSLIQNVNLVWHKFSAEKPTRTNRYLIKIKNGILTTHYSYIVDTWFTQWQEWVDTNNRVVVAWAELPECKFRLEG